MRRITSISRYNSTLRMVILLTVLIILLGIPKALIAQTFNVLYAFSGGEDGAYPNGLVRDAQGNLYGTTTYGGAPGTCRGAGCGVVFKLNGKTVSYTVLYSFNFPFSPGDGAHPTGILIQEGQDNLYGTTYLGGNAPNFPDPNDPTFRTGCGTVFKVDQAGNETVLYNFGCGFSSPPDGAGINGGMIRDALGNFYGTTQYGGIVKDICGPNGCGVVYKLDKNGKEKVLHAFTGAAGDGSVPNWGLTRDAQGNLFGTTVYGGGGPCNDGFAVGCGTVFKLDKSGAETVLYSFTGGADGAYPFAGLIHDAEGNLYGTAQYGGDYGAGVVFKLDQTGKQTVLYSFKGGVDGGNPAAGLTRDAEGNLYGTTIFGGSGPCVLSFGIGCGTVFKLDKSGAETVLYSFTGGADGAYPQRPLIRDGEGNLYGVTLYGGGGPCNDGTAVGCGTVFKLTVENEDQ